jgi:hypothetical protein
LQTEILSYTRHTDCPPTSLLPFSIPLQTLSSNRLVFFFTLPNCHSS